MLRDIWRSSAVGAAVRGLAGRERALTSPAGTSPWIAPEPWIASEPGLRAEVARNVEESRHGGTSAPGFGSGYLQDIRSRLDDPRPWHRTEESFLLGRCTGVRVQDPLWDPNLVELLVRIHPLACNEGGLTKALVRSTLARRFPGLGFESQRKSPLGTFIRSVTSTQTGSASRALGDVTVLGELGVVEPEQVRVFLNNPPQGKEWRVWDILNLEAWARAYYRPETRRACLG